MRICRTVLLFSMASLLVAADGTLFPASGWRDLSPKQFDDLLRKGLNASRPPWTGAIARVRPGTLCAIPLLESPIEHPEQFTIKRMPIRPEKLDPMAVPPPVPACKDWNK
jgi:hypothetical protein